MPSETRLRRRLFVARATVLWWAFFSLVLSAYAGPAQAADRLPEPSPEPETAKKVCLQGGINSFGILTEQLQTDLGIGCSTDGKGGVRIANVHPTSEAAFKGLRRGDLILDARRDRENRICITIRRDDRTYQAQLDGQNNFRLLRPQTAKSDQASPPVFQLDASKFGGFAIDSRQINVLSQYNLELIIDRSLSMQVRDCPGGLSRWDWSAGQATAIAKALSAYAPTGLTVTRFASQYDVHEHAPPAAVADLLSRHDFQLGTRLAEPLADRLDKFLANHRSAAKPLLIAIITDGCPAPRPEPMMVVDELIRASHRMTSPQEVAVVFLQIGGDDDHGRNYLLGLGNNLVSYGARYQFVHTSTFEELQAVGLAQALVNAVQQRTPGPNNNRAHYDRWLEANKAPLGQNYQYFR